MRSLTVIALTVMLLLTFMGSVFSAGQDVQNAPLVIDVRTQAEWDAGHLEGAILIPHDRITAEIGKSAPDKATKIYLYCRSGRRTGLAFDDLKKQGYSDLINLGTMENAATVLDKKVVK